MRILCVIPCGKAKIWDKFPTQGATKAKYVYTGPFAKKCREYAEKFYPSTWCILSAKYGFLMPDDLVPGPYNFSFNDKKTNPIKIDELLVQPAQKKLDTYDRVVVLGGKNYAGIMQEVFSKKKTYIPLKGCTLFEMMEKLHSAINNGIVL